MNLIDSIESQQLKENQIVFRAGDTLKVHVRIVEGATFEGDCRMADDPAREMETPARGG